eukprot:UN26359
MSLSKLSVSESRFSGSSLGRFFRGLFLSFSLEPLSGSSSGSSSCSLGKSSSSEYWSVRFGFFLRFFPRGFFDFSFGLLLSSGLSGSSESRFLGDSLGPFLSFSGRPSSEAYSGSLPSDGSSPNGSSSSPRESPKTGFVGFFRLRFGRSSSGDSSGPVPFLRGFPRSLKAGPSSGSSSGRPACVGSLLSPGIPSSPEKVSANFGLLLDGSST